MNDLSNNSRRGWRWTLFAIVVSLWIAHPVLGQGKAKSSKEKKDQAAAKTKPERKSAKVVPPVCRSPLHHPTPQEQMRRPAQSMPEMFARMGEGFMRNPAGGFSSWLDELAKMEESALTGVTLTIAEEQAYGRKARDEYLRMARQQGYPELNGDKRIDYLHALAAKAAKYMKNRDRYSKFDIKLVDSPISDGQSFPGGYLVFTTALLKEPDEATVFGVVAHEIAHMDRGHLYQYAKRSKLGTANPGFARGPMNGPAFNQMFTQQAALLGLMMNPYRPEHEHDADCWAVTAMFLEGYDPIALAKMLERMHERLRDAPANPFFNFGRAHPYTLERRQAVVDRLKQLQRWRKDQALGRHPEALKALKPL